ncbi:MAG: hypothetical protein OHK0026_09560 [Rhodocyclaceae bacterium]
MLKLFSGRSDHPLASDEELDRICTEAAGMEPRAALREIADWLDSLDAAEELGTERRYAVAARLEDAAWAPQRATVRDIFTVPRQVKGYSVPLFHLGRRLWRCFAAAYMRCLDAQEGREGDLARRVLPQLAARCLRAHGQWLKWSEFRYGPIDPLLWQNAGAAYLAAVDAGCERRRVPAPAGAVSFGCAQDEYLHALVLHLSAPDRLRPIEIEIADRLIARFLPAMRLLPQATPEAVYWVDPARPMAPMRIARTPSASASLRYIDVSEAAPAVAELAGRASKGDLPADLDLGGSYPARVVAPVAAHLARYWGARPPVRVHPRHSVHSPARSVLGFAHIFGQLSGKAAGAVAWEIEDVSRGGFGIRASLPDDDVLRLGTLLGLQPGGGENWLVGIVRRITRDAETRGRLGIETLSHGPVALEVELGGRRTDVLLLDPLEPGATVRLVLPQFGYEEAVRLRLSHEGRIAEIDPAGLLESAEGCDVARYRVLSVRPAGPA